MPGVRAPLRILDLVESTDYLLDTRVRLHAEALAAAGYDIRVICPSRRRERLRRQVNGVQLHRFPLPFRGTTKASYLAEFLCSTLVMALMTLWELATQGVDVIHFYSPPDSLFLACLLPVLVKKTIIYDLRDLSPELYETKFGRASGVLYSLLLFFERCACRLADRIIVVNESYRRIVVQRDKARPEQVSVIRYGPDLAHVHPTEIDPGLRAQADIIIAYLGGMDKQDGVDHLLRALHHLDRQFGHTSWLCVLMGSGPELKALEKVAQELGIGDRVRFTGFIPCDRWVRILSTADIGVEPAPANPLNNVSTMIKLMDYMAIGKPAVAYDLPESRITGGDALLYARPNDEVDMAGQISRLIEDPDLRARLGAIGRQRAEQQLGWDRQLDGLLDLYSRLAQRLSDLKPLPNS